MKTRHDEPLRFAELARRGARIERQVAGRRLPRWSALVGEPGALAVTLDFHQDDDGMAWVAGSVTARCRLLCNRCAEPLERCVQADFELCIVNEAAAAALGDGRDVLVPAGDTVSIPDIVEDELILSLPERLCEALPCARLPRLSYPADAGGDAEATAGNPFDVLADLKRPAD